eukprot:TRINITY_DN16117_c0_g1_i1.p1 TRINITY_DN16117_c0_g1~~TRINITY_DN16117_c0_g1_i1.p1  ORF type:complete len:629 (-),score=194.83 TRINITY_DN16117_c0_g1_i1:143-2029(-)
MTAPQSAATLPDGVTKETVRHPPTHKYLSPQPGDEVEIHFVCSLKKGGEVFESSRLNDAPPVKFKLDAAQAPTLQLEAFERYVQALKKGEKAKFTLPPEHAYGSDGLPGKVPPDSAIELELELMKCPLREDLFEDGGVIKLELKEGTGPRPPRNNDECLISYKVTVEGCGVAMQAQHGVYKMGSAELGQIARVLDKALATMKRGDDVVLTCQPKYAFGEAGGKYAGKVATISLSLEQIFEVHDCSLGERDCTVLRKRTKESDTKDRLHDTARVTLRVKTVRAGDDEILRDPKEFTFVAGDGDMCDGIEGAVIWMKRGEEAVVRCNSSDAAAGGLLGLPGGLQTPVMIFIELLQFETVLEKWDMSSEQRLERGRARKETAGGLFKRGRIRLAAQHYEAIADLFASIDFFKVEEQPEALELRRIANLNKAMCMLKMGKMDAVVSLCSGVLKEEPGNAKALFRRAKARLEKKDAAGAIEDLTRLLEVDPSNVEGRNLLREAKRLRKAQDSHSSTTYSRMVAGLGSLPERTRKDDDIVVMPNLDEEYARIMKEAGLAVPPSQAAGTSAAGGDRSANGVPSAAAAAAAAVADVQGSEVVSQAPLGDTGSAVTPETGGTPGEAASSSGQPQGGD